MKKLRLTFEVEIDNAKLFRETWKEEGYDNIKEFLEDYLSMDESVTESLIDFPFSFNKFKLVDCKE